MNLLSKFRAVTDKILLLAIIILFFLMFGITNANVFMRYLFNRPIVISVELARYCFVAIIYLGAIITARRDKHIALDFFVNFLPHKLRLFLEQVGRVLMAAFFLVFLYYAIEYAVSNANVLSTAMQVPMMVIYLPMVFGAAGIVIETCINIYLYGTGKKQRLSEVEELEEEKILAENGGTAE